MKKKLIELDVDFIGGGEPLTKEEAKAISEYFLAQKAKTNKSSTIPKTIVGKNAKKHQ